MRPLKLRPHLYFLLLISACLIPSLGFAETIDDCASGKGNVVVIEPTIYIHGSSCEATISITTSPDVHVEGGR